MRLPPELKPALEKAKEHLKHTKYWSKGRPIDDTSLNSYRDCLESCVNLRELQYHCNLFSKRHGLAIITLQPL